MYIYMPCSYSKDNRDNNECDRTRKHADSLGVLLEQHWLHCRHLESERSWFMNAYAVVVGGVAAFISTTELKPSPILVFLVGFIIVFTFVGFFLTTRWTYSFECHRKKVNELSRILWLVSGRNELFDPTMDIPAMYILPGSNWFSKIVNEWFRTRYWFPLFYLLISLGLVYLSSDLFMQYHNSAQYIRACYTMLSMASLAFIVAVPLCVSWWSSLTRLDKNKRIILEGCNGEWAQKQYLPFLVQEAVKGNIELLAVDISPELKLCNPRISALWKEAKDKGKACYVDKVRNKTIYEALYNIYSVFIVTPDGVHSEVTRFWLERLATNGEIFIEKPLDASLNSAFELENNLAKQKEKVFVFDHYLARAYPFLIKKLHQKRGGRLTKIEFFILEQTEITLQRKITLDKGMIFDLFSHVLALTVAILDKNLTPSVTRLKEMEINQVEAGQYNDCPINGETFALINGGIVNESIELKSAVGKCVGTADDKWMKLYFKNGEGVEINFESNAFFAFSPSSPKNKLGNLDPNPVGSFLKGVLQDKKPPLSLPGVISFDTSLEILKKLDEAKNKIDVMPKYQPQ